jgi:protocatechuate 3,4-dioxygenase beta subunit
MRILPLAFIILCVFPVAAQPPYRAGQVGKAAADNSIAADSRPETRPQGAISGRILGEDSRPIANVRVVIYALNPNRQKTVAGQTETNPDGVFRATSLTPALYQVAASAPGYVSNLEGTDNLDGNQQNYRIGDTVNITMYKGGVITGRVIDADGEPIIGVAVQAVTALKKDRPQIGLRSFLTDDRGVYRMYGLVAGSYLVMVNTNVPGASGSRAALQGDISTYYPSSTRYDAVEIAVRNGAEVSGIDIRHQGEPGNRLSGQVSGVATSGAASPTGPVDAIQIILSQVPTGLILNTVSMRPQGSPNSFTFYGLSDGEYELIARQIGRDRDGYSSTPQRVTIKGKEVTGIELKLIPLGSIAGRILLEPRPKTGKQDICKPLRSSTPAESLISLRHDRPSNSAAPRTLPLLNPYLLPLKNSVGENGEFILRSLTLSHYRLILQLPTEDWYLRAITLPKAGSNKAEDDVGGNGIALKQGEAVIGLKVMVAEGAAGLKGKVVAERNAKLPTALRIHLVPFEQEAIADVLRYAETVTTSDSFTFTNLAPGKYRVLAQALLEDETSNEQARPVTWDLKSRLRLWQAAERVGLPIELLPCQRLTDLTIRFSAAK